MCFSITPHPPTQDIELLRRTAKDVFRFLPFASFILTTGFTMTYLVWVRLFPFILPSHFRKAAGQNGPQNRFF